jgi:hypothetical protein
MCSRYRLLMLPENSFDLIDVSTTSRPPIATPTVVVGDLFFGQWGDQLNGGRGTADFQPGPIVLIYFSISFCST